MIINDANYKDNKTLYKDGSILAELINFSDNSSMTGIAGGSTAASTVLLDILEQKFNALVQYDTTANWATKTTLVSKKGEIYVYSDHDTVDGHYVPGIKIGDGLAFVIDLPFLDEPLYEHINDISCHVSAADRDLWNNKHRAYTDVNVPETLIFTTDLT
jgi:hypothetical protein